MSKITKPTMIIILMALFLTTACEETEELKRSTFEIMEQTMEKAKDQIDQVKDKVDQLKNSPPENTSNEQIEENAEPNDVNNAKVEE